MSQHEEGIRFADLHCHTTCSDGSLSPVELINRAKQEGLKALSITDHDTIAAYDTALLAAAAAGILLKTGVEFSCSFKGHSVHVLGYNYDLHNEALHLFCKRHLQRRQERNRAILELLKKAKMPISEEELGSSESIGRPHIARVMVQKGYVETIRQAFQLYLGDDKSCCVPGPVFSVQETLDTIHHAQGKAFLAHPHLMSNGEIIKELLALPFDGIECYYSLCHSSQEKRWKKLAEKRGLLISGGSDFHGEVRPHVPLGSSWVDEKTFYTIFS